MKKLLLVFSFLAFTFSISFGQIRQGAIIDTTYKTYSQGKAIIQTRDGGFLIVGYGTYRDSSGIYVLKLDLNLNWVWTKTIGVGSGNSVVQDAAGNYVIAGSTNAYGVDSNDVYVVKLDSLGNIIWTRTIGGSGNEYGNSIALAKNGGYTIAGYTNSFGAGGNDVYLIKLDTAGNLKWTRTFGGTNDDKGNSVSATNDGGYVIAGSTNSVGAGSYDVYVIKTDSSGNYKWSRTIGGSQEDDGNSIIQTQDGGYAIAGQTSSYGPTGMNAYIIKLDSSKNLSWAKAMGQGNDAANGIAQTPNGLLGVVGYTYYYGSGGTGSISVLQFHNDGTLKSSRAEGQLNSFGYGITATTDNGFATVGQGSWAPNYFGTLVFKFDSVLNICITKYGGGSDTVSGGILGSGGAITKSGGTITSMNRGVDSAGGGIYNICDLLTGEENISLHENSVSVYPNPSNGIFNFQLQGTNQKASIEVYNMLGKKVYQAPLNPPIGVTSETTISLPNVEGGAGIYLYRIISEKGEAIVSGKLVIE